MRVNNITKAAAHITTAVRVEWVLEPNGNCVQLNDIELLIVCNPLGILDVVTTFSSMLWPPLLTVYKNMIIILY